MYYIHHKKNRKAIHQHLLICNLQPCSSKNIFISNVIIKNHLDVCSSVRTWTLPDSNRQIPTFRRSMSPHKSLQLLCCLRKWSWYHHPLRLKYFCWQIEEKCYDIFRYYLPLYPITIGTLSEFRVLNISTASFAIGSVVVVTAEVGVTVGLTSSQS